MACIQLLSCGGSKDCLGNDALTAMPPSADSGKPRGATMPGNRKPAGILKSRANTGIVGGLPPTSMQDSNITRGPISNGHFRRIPAPPPRSEHGSAEPTNALRCETISSSQEVVQRKQDRAFWIAMDLRTPISHELERAKNAYDRREEQLKRRGIASRNTLSPSSITSRHMSEWA